MPHKGFRFSKSVSDLCRKVLGLCPCQDDHDGLE